MFPIFFYFNLLPHDEYTTLFCNLIKSMFILMCPSQFLLSQNMFRLFICSSIKITNKKCDRNYVYLTFGTILLICSYKFLNARHKVTIGTHMNKKMFRVKRWHVDKSYFYKKKYSYLGPFMLSVSHKHFATTRVNP